MNQRTIGPVSLTWVLRIFWIRSIWKHIWPCKKMVKVNPGSSYENIGRTWVPDAVCQDSRSSASWFWRRRFFEVFHHIWAWSCDLEHLNKFSFLTSLGGSIWNLASIGLAFSEQRTFVNVESEWPWTKVNEWVWPLIFIKVHVNI